MHSGGGGQMSSGMGLNKGNSDYTISDRSYGVTPVSWISENI